MATITASTPAMTATQTSVPYRNPKDSMKSTWRTDKSQWGLAHYIYNNMDLWPMDLDRKAPVFQKTDRIPIISTWQAQRFVLIYALVPMAIHQAYWLYTGRNLSIWAAFIFYGGALKFMGAKEMQIIRRLGYQVGYLDGDKHARDEVPDHSVAKVVISLLATTNVRSLFSMIIAYKSENAPSSLNWLALPFEIAIYSVVLDFFFYWYHRLMHANDSLWQFHRTHHLTKHPSPTLSMYGDQTQEIFDIAGIPLITYVTMKYVLGFPMGFYEWWIAQFFVTYVEIFGHSGLRVWSTTPNPLSPLLHLLGAELVIEDHDLHHRTGWKKSHNYGKQTLIWDLVFGTTAPRIEAADANVDWDRDVGMPLW